MTDPNEPMIEVPFSLFQQMFNLLIVEQQRAPTMTSAQNLIAQYSAGQAGPKLVKDKPGAG